MPFSQVDLCLSAEKKRMIGVRRNQHGWIGLVFNKVCGLSVIPSCLFLSFGLTRLDPTPTYCSDLCLVS